MFLVFFLVSEVWLYGYFLLEFLFSNYSLLYVVESTINMVWIVRIINCTKMSNLLSYKAGSPLAFSTNAAITFLLLRLKGDSAFPWISAQPLLGPLLNLHTTLYSHVSDHIPPCVAIAWSYLILRAIPAINETNAPREVLWQRVGKFLLKSTIALYAWVLTLSFCSQCGVNWDFSSSWSGLV